jgi:serine/threonine-protein kinase HipA
MIKNLDVYIWNQKVGSLIAYSEKYSEKSCFYFDKDFAKGPLDIAPLRAPIRNSVVQNGLPIYADDGKLFGGLPSFVADSLPDHWGNKVFETWAKSNHLKLKDISSLDRLAYIGRRGMGALEFVPPVAEDMESPFKVSIADLHELSQFALNKAKDFSAKLADGIMLQSLFKVGTSAGGRRPKAIINVNFDTMDCYSGQVATPAPGYTPMIIKFDEHIDVPTTRIEFCYYLMAKEVGLKMMPSQLFSDGDYVHFLTERFDRKGVEKVHVQTLAAMNPLATGYEDLFDVASKLGVNCAEIQQLFLQMVMNVLGANVDDHNKNFSFIMSNDGKWHVAPAYDYTFAVDVSSPWYVNCHCLTINGKNRNIERTDMLHIARKYNVKNAEPLLDKAINVVSNFDAYAQKADIDVSWRKNIQAHLDESLENAQKKE